MVTSSCEHCAGLVLNCGRVSHIVYDRPYRDRRGLDALRGGGVTAVSLQVVTRVVADWVKR